jgi:hypothetical protein
VAIEFGGIRIGTRAEEIEVEIHIKTTWERGQAAIKLLRAKLGDDAGDIAPMVKLWVKFGSIFFYRSHAIFSNRFFFKIKYSGKRILFKAFFKNNP